MDIKTAKLVWVHVWGYDLSDWGQEFMDEARIKFIMSPNGMFKTLKAMRELPAKYHSNWSFIQSTLSYNFNFIPTMDACAKRGSSYSKTKTPPSSEKHIIEACHLASLDALDL